MKTRIGLLPGVVKDDSQLVARSRFVRADKVRFRSIDGINLPETLGGIEHASSSVMGDEGVTRAIHSWADNDQNIWCAFGSHRGLWVMDRDGTLYDITPVIERGELSSAITTSSGSATIQITDDAHGLIAGQKVKLTGASSVAGVTVSGEYYVSTVVNSSTYTLDVSTANATSSMGGGSVIDYEYFLPPGNVDSLGAAGYGTGPYSGGQYSSPSSAVSLNARVPIIDHWGQNGFIGIPGYPPAEWAPTVSASELVTNGDMSSSVGWTQGSGWTVDGTQASAASAANLDTSVLLSQGAWHLLDFDVSTVSAGTVVPVLDGSTVGALITSAGTYKRVVFNGAGGQATLRFSGFGNFTGKLDNVSLKTLTTAHFLPSPAPQTANGVCVTPERIAVAWGVPDDDGNTDPLRVAWSGQENNQDWTSSAANLAGFFTLSQGSKVLRVLPGRSENLVGTDTAIYSMRYVPNPSVVYRSDLIATGCGFAGPNAGCQINGIWFWVSPAGEFYRYAGGLTPLQCPNAKDYFDNLSKVQGYKIFCFPIASKNEVWWLYPDSRDGNECSRYLIYNFLDNTWSEGTWDRSAMEDAGIFPYPIGVDLDGKPWYHEKGDSSVGSPRASYLESGWFDIADGEGHVSIYGVIPDFASLKGGLTITLKTRLYPNDPDERTYGPRNVTGSTLKVDFRAQGRQAKYIIEANDSPSFWRMGAPSFDLKVTGVKR